jgi:hypothetical protein
MTLWLDDIREPWKHGYVGAEWAKTAERAIEVLKTGLVDFASLDHDLSEAAKMGCAPPNEPTGYTVVCWLEANPEFWPERGVKVHSMNPVGAKRMRQVIEAHYGRRFDSLAMQERQYAT